MKRTELRRKTPLARTGNFGQTNVGRGQRNPAKTLKRGRGFAASPAQREKVRGMACACCGEMASEYHIIDPAHICARGMGGCDDPLCVIPLCRGEVWGCHRSFDEGTLDIDKFLEPQFRAEVAHAVTHLGLEGTRRRLAPSLYRNDRLAA